jgi:very-short-patch-repair endonuclease
MLAIEIDGSQHQTPWMNAYDGRRWRGLRAEGVEVVRITNLLLIRDARLAAQCLQAAIDTRASEICFPVTKWLRAVRLR